MGPGDGSPESSLTPAKSWQEYQPWRRIETGEVAGSEFADLEFNGLPIVGRALHHLILIGTFRIMTVVGLGSPSAE